NTEVEKFENAQLVLRASSTAWATQLRLLTPQLMHKFDEVLGTGVITKLEIKGPAGRNYGHRARPGRRQVSKRYDGLQSVLWLRRRIRPHNPSHHAPTEAILDVLTTVLAHSTPEFWAKLQ